MGARRQCNRYKTAPYGTSKEDVLKRAKRFFRIDGEFMIHSGGSLWFSDYLPHFGPGAFPSREDYKWHEPTKRWRRVAVYNESGIKVPRQNLCPGFCEPDSL